MPSQSPPAFRGSAIHTAVPRSLTQWNGQRRRAGCASARCAGGRLARAPGEAGERARAGAPGRSAWRRGAAAGRGVAMGACWPSQPSVCPPSRRPPRAVRGTGLPLGPVHPGRLSRRPPASHSFSQSPLGPFAPPVPSQRASAPAPSRPRPRPAQSSCPRPSGAFAARRARAPFPGGGGGGGGLPRLAWLPQTSGERGQSWGTATEVPLACASRLPTLWFAWPH